MKKVHFNDHKTAACYKLVDDNGVRALVSYTTTVIEIDNDRWLKVNGLYSATTIKHISWFMRELGLSYQTAKHLYEKNLRLNLETGEIAA